MTGPPRRAGVNTSFGGAVPALMPPGGVADGRRRAGFALLTGTRAFLGGKSPGFRQQERCRRARNGNAAYQTGLAGFMRCIGLWLTVTSMPSHAGERWRNLFGAGHTTISSVERPRPVFRPAASAAPRWSGAHRAPARWFSVLNIRHQAGQSATRYLH